MARPLLAALAATALLAGCSTTDTRYENRGYGYNDGYGRTYNRSYPVGRPYYGNGDADRYYRRDRDDSGRRLVRPDNNVVCDRKTDVCYKKGEIDASETRDYFGRKDGQRADKIRDKYENSDIFLPRKNVVCDKDDKVCYNNGRVSEDKTRDYFGKKAARRVDDKDGDRRR